MSKVDLDIVKMVLKRNELDQRTVSQIVEDIDSALKEEEMAKEAKPPAVKKQFCILVSDPEGALEGKDLTGWVVQIPEDDSPMVTEDRLVKAAYDFNATPKGSRLPVESIGEAREAVPARIAKEHNIWIKTKEPVLVLRTNNEIPTQS